MADLDNRRVRVPAVAVGRLSAGGRSARSSLVRSASTVRGRGPTVSVKTVGRGKRVEERRWSRHHLQHLNCSRVCVRV